MKIDFSQLVKNIEGQPFQMMIEKEGKPEKKEMTLGMICVEALGAQIPGENVDGVEKFKRYQLIRKIFFGGELELEPEDIVKIKDLVGKTGSTAVVGPVWEILNGKEDKAK